MSWLLIRGARRFRPLSHCGAIIAQRCRRSQPTPCSNVLCDICLHRSFYNYNFAGNFDTRKEVGSISPTLPLSPGGYERGSAPASPQRRAPMPEVVSTACGVAQAAIHAEAEDLEMMGGEPSPRTPKRAAAVVIEDDERIRAPMTTPAKHPRQQQQQQQHAPTLDAEPTNRDLMAFLQGMQAQQALAMQGLVSRLAQTESRIENLEGTTTRRFTELETRAAGEDRAAATRVRTLEENMNSKIAELSAKMERIATSAAAAQSSTTAVHTRGDDGLEATVVLGGWPQETPRGAIEDSFRQHALPAIQADMSSLQAKCSSPSQARSLVAAVRRLQISFPFQSGRINMYATLQKPREIREKNRALMKLASTLQEGMTQGLPRAETWRCVCWASSSIVIADCRILKLTRNADGCYTVTFIENWYSPRIFSTPKEELESRVKGWFEADGRPAL